MSIQQNPNFQYLNRDGQWADFELERLQLDANGSLHLATVPRLNMQAGDLSDLDTPNQIAAVDMTVDGTFYVAQPSKDQVLRIDGCDGQMEPMPCASGSGSLPTQFRQPHGILVDQEKGRLFVADSGNHRLQIFSLDTHQLLGVWGGVWGDQGERPSPRKELGCFDFPTDLAQDSYGNIYVVDFGNQRVQKLNERGHPFPGFWAQLYGEAGDIEPLNIAVGWIQERERLFILDQLNNRIILSTLQGHVIDHVQLEPRFAPMGLAVTSSAIYIGDNHGKQLHKFQPSEFGQYTYIGPAVDYRGPTAGMTIDQSASILWLNPGGDQPLHDFRLDGGNCREGWFWGLAISSTSGAARAWHSLRADASYNADEAGLQLFVYTSMDAMPPPDPQGDQTQAWIPIPPNTLNSLIPLDPSQTLWVAGRMTSSGLTSPILKQIKVLFDHKTYRRRLPPIFSEGEAQRDFLDRILSLFETMYSEVEEQIDDLSLYADADAIPDGWLPWLAGWLALDLDERWQEPEKRAAIRQAFRSYGQKGTTEGLGSALLQRAGVDALIEEPITHTDWWVLGGAELLDASSPTTRLGFTTRLAPTEIDTPIVGTTATLDRVDLIDIDDFGASLFTPFAYQFCVSIYRGQVRTDADVRRIHEIIEGEKPAHTSYSLRIIEPAMQIGLQAQIGVDTVLSGCQPSAAKPTKVLGELVLQGVPPARLGADSQIGVNTRINV